MGSSGCAGEAGGRGQEAPLTVEGSGSAKAVTLGVLMKITCTQMTRFFVFCLMLFS